MVDTELQRSVLWCSGVNKAPLKARLSERIACCSSCEIQLLFRATLRHRDLPAIAYGAPVAIPVCLPADILAAIQVQQPSGVIPAAKPQIITQPNTASALGSKSSHSLCVSPADCPGRLPKWRLWNNRPGESPAAASSEITFQSIKGLDVKRTFSGFVHFKKQKKKLWVGHQFHWSESLIGSVRESLLYLKGRFLFILFCFYHYKVIIWLPFLVRGY